MNRLSGFIVKHRKAISAGFFALLILSAFSISWVHVENDVTVYLSDSTESKKGMMLMQDEFITYATADIMVENISEDEADDILQMLQSTEGVLMVGFDTTESHYKENCALYNISFDGPAEEESVIRSFNAVKQSLTDYTFYVSSESFSDMSEILSSEMAGVVVIVIIAVFAVLLFTSSTYAEVLVLLLTFAAAAVINMGTHFLLGTISFVSNSVAIVIQLALSLDYAIILCNRYKEEHQTKPIEEAVRSALALSIPEISASSLTTIAGLAAMTFMQFKLGLDLGIALIKAIVVSLLTVFLLMPALLIAFGKLIDKTKHRRFIPEIPFAGKFAYAARYVIPPVFVALVLFAFVSFGKENYAYTIELVDSIRQSETDISQDKINERFGKNHMLPLMVPAGDYDKEAALIAELEKCDEVNSVLGLASIDAINGYTLGQSVNYLDFMKIANVDETTAQALFAYYAADSDDYALVADDLASYKVPLVDLFLMVHEVAENGAVELPQEQVELIDSLYAQLQMAQDQLQGKDYSRIIIYVDLPEQSKETFDFLDQVHVMADNYYPDDEVYLTGMAVAARDFNETFKVDSGIVSTLSILFVLIILFFTFKSVALPLMLILVIQGSIWLNFSIPVWTGSYVYFMWYLIVSSIQMGANIDYAIVVSSRYTSLRANHISKKDAMIETLNRAFPTIMSSGILMVVAGLLIGFRVSYSVISGMGLFIGIGTLITLCLVLFALPTLLLLGDTVIQKTTLSLASKIHLKHPQRTLRRALSILLCCAAVMTLILAPYSKRRVSGISDATLERCTQQLSAISSLEELSEKFDLSQTQYDEAKLNFAEGYVTESVGREQLEDGEKQYNEGKRQLDAGEAEYAAGYAQYQEGLAAYEQGKAELASGQTEYNAGKAKYEASLQEYKTGLDQYNEGLKQYEAGKAEYEAGLQAYNEGKAKYDASLAEYNRAKALLDSVEGVYNTVLPFYNDYQSLEERYQNAVDSGNQTEAALLAIRLTAGKAAFETSLGQYGSIGDLIEAVGSARDELAAAEVELENGKAELAAGEKKLADGKAELEAAEAELAAGKAALEHGEAELAKGKQELVAGEKELNAGKAELSAGEKELNNAKNQLTDARTELDDGHSQLRDADRQLNDGRQVLSDNSVKLQGSLDDLSKFSDEKERLSQGIELLLAVPGIQSAVSKHASYDEICSAARNYYTAMTNQVAEETRYSGWTSVLFMAAAALALFAALLLLKGRHLRSIAISSVFSAILSAIGFVLWKLHCPDYAVFMYIVGSLCLIAAICAEFIARQTVRRKAEADTTADGHENLDIPDTTTGQTE